VGGGFFLTVASLVKVRFEKLVIQSGNSGQTALRVDFLISTNDHRNNLLVMESVQIQNNFACAVMMSLASNAIFSNCMFTGTGTAGPGVGIWFRNGMSVNTVISNCNLNFLHYAVYCPIYQEGIAIVNTLMIGVRYGVFVTSNHGSGLRSTNIMITGTHIDARGNPNRALWFNNVSEIFISSSLILGSTSNPDGWASDFICVFKRVFEMCISGSQIYGAHTSGGAAVLFDSAVISPFGTLGCKACSIVGSTFRGADVDVRITADCNTIIIQHNTKSLDNHTNDPDFMTNQNLGTYCDVQPT
jgi:hypothetical protein